VRPLSAAVGSAAHVSQALATQPNGPTIGPSVRLLLRRVESTNWLVRCHCYRRAESPVWIRLTKNRYFFTGLLPGTLLKVCALSALVDETLIISVRDLALILSYFKQKLLNMRIGHALREDAVFLCFIPPKSNSGGGGEEVALRIYSPRFGRDAARAHLAARSLRSVQPTLLR
jgi:hypothetical protein